LFDWVSYPITILIKWLYEKEMKTIEDKARPSPYRLELIAALERTLCFCHTGSTAVLATSLMNPLGLSRGLTKDGFPMLLKVFVQPTILNARKHGLEIDPREWPLKDEHPAIASRRAQILTYSLEHFMVSGSILGTDVVRCDPFIRMIYMWALFMLQPLQPPRIYPGYIRGTLSCFNPPAYIPWVYTRDPFMHQPPAYCIYPGLIPPSSL
jgi:hypothetical protein